jgi:hypothetical protein
MANPIKLILDRKEMEKQQKEAAKKFAEIMRINNSIMDGGKKK